jgi:hypothetical protein
VCRFASFTGAQVEGVKTLLQEAVHSNQSSCVEARSLFYKNSAHGKGGKVGGKVGCKKVRELIVVTLATMWCPRLFFLCTNHRSVVGCGCGVWRCGIFECVCCRIGARGSFVYNPLLSSS